MPEIEPQLIADFELGEKAREFLSSDLGRYIAGACRQDEEEAKDKWLDVDPYDTETVRKLQIRAKLPRMLMEYINELIQRGEEADAIIQQENE